MSKVYYRKQVEEIQHQYHNALALGPAAAEEWLKGLVDLGKSKIADSARWERWQAQFAPGTGLSSVLREYFRLSSASRVNAAQPSTSGALLPQSLPSKSSPRGVFPLTSACTAVLPSSNCVVSSYSSIPSSLVLFDSSSLIQSHLLRGLILTKSH